MQHAQTRSVRPVRRETSGNAGWGVGRDTSDELQYRWWAMCFCMLPNLLAAPAPRQGRQNSKGEGEPMMVVGLPSSWRGCPTNTCAVASSEGSGVVALLDDTGSPLGVALCACQTARVEQGEKTGWKKKGRRVNGQGIHTTTAPAGVEGS